MHELFICNENNFHQIERTKGLAVVRFFASWCPPCRDSEALFNEFAEQLEHSVIVGSVNIDQSPVLTTRYEIWRLPSVLVFKDGQLIKRIVGGESSEHYQPEQPQGGGETHRTVPSRTDRGEGRHTPRL